MRTPVDDSTVLELALLRRGVVQRADALVRCGHCHRTPLVGERVYVYEREAVRCELCRTVEHGDPVDSHLVHGPEFGHSIRLTDRRAA